MTGPKVARVKSEFLHLRYQAGQYLSNGRPHYLREHLAERSDQIRDGIWSRWDWDGVTFEASNCRFGMVPLYYFESADGFCIAESIETLLAQGAPRELDEAGLAVFIRRQTFLDGDTPFKAIRCLPPNSRLTWSKDGLKLQSEAFHSAPLNLKPSAVLEGLHELFAQSVARRLPKNGRFTVPLSGGKESRRILLELVRQKHKPDFCVTALHPPPRINEDAKVAAQLLERLGIEHRIVPAQWSGFEPDRDKNLRTDFSTLEHSWVLPMADILANSVATVYDGINIDCGMYSDKRARLFAEGRLTELAIDLLRDSETALSRILSEESYRRFSREKAIERTVEELKKHVDQACPTSSFLFWSRMRRAVAPVPFGLLRDIETVHTPFLDKDFFEFVMSVPEPALVGGHVFKQAIATSYPEVRDIPYADNSLTSQPNRLHNRRYLAQLARHLAFEGRRSSLINIRRTFSDLVKGMFSGSQERFDWMQPRLTSYLLQLESAAQS